MHVRVDQSGHEDAAAAIDNVHLFVRLLGGRNPANQAIVHQHIETFAQHLGIAVKDARVSHFARTCA